MTFFEFNMYRVTKHLNGMTVVARDGEIALRKRKAVVKVSTIALEEVLHTYFYCNTCIHSHIHTFTNEIQKKTTERSSQSNEPNPLDALFHPKTIFVYIPILVFILSFFKSPDPNKTVDLTNRAVLNGKKISIYMH